MKHHKLKSTRLGSKVREWVWWTRVHLIRTCGVVVAKLSWVEGQAPLWGRRHRCQRSETQLSSRRTDRVQCLWWITPVRCVTLRLTCAPQQATSTRPDSSYLRVTSSSSSKLSESWETRSIRAISMRLYRFKSSTMLWLGFRMIWRKLHRIERKIASYKKKRN